MRGSYLHAYLSGTSFFGTLTLRKVAKWVDTVNKIFRTDSYDIALTKYVR